MESVLREEGGYVANPADPGGETNFGISKRAYPDEDIKNLTVERAKELYRRDYWTPMGLDASTFGDALVLMDCAVNQGVSRAKAFRAEVSAPFVVNFQARRALHYASLPTFQTFGKGWMRRLIRVAVEAGK